MSGNNASLFAFSYFANSINTSKS